MIGTGVRILPELKIGDRSILGAGAVVVNNVEEDSTVMGVPAKPRK
jgi:acetyltransferase-like isoleucine patch superfamily enzyme